MRTPSRRRVRRTRRSSGGIEGAADPDAAPDRGAVLVSREIGNRGRSELLRNRRNRGHSEFLAGRFGQELRMTPIHGDQTLPNVPRFSDTIPTELEVVQVGASGFLFLGRCAMAASKRPVPQTFYDPKMTWITGAVCECGHTDQEHHHAADNGDPGSCRECACERFRWHHFLFLSKPRRS